MQSKVILLRYTPNPTETIAMAAKLCYSPSNILDLQEKIEEKDQEAFVQKLIDIGHMSPIEHVSFTFGIEGISRACSHQLVRHRVASFSQQSQRYVPEKQFDFVMPPTLETPYRSDIFEKFMQDAQFVYNQLLQDGVPAEDARFVLPNACETKIVVTMNARELLHFFRVRTCNRAQWEIRAMAKQMLHLCKEAAPVIFSKSGPGCLYSACGEGKMSCGKILEVKTEFGVK